MRILVTGVSGFSGSHVARHLSAAGMAVTGLYRRETAFLAGVRALPAVTLIQTGLDEAAKLPGPFHAIIHAAATSPQLGVSDDMIIHDNRQGTRSLLTAARLWKSELFIFFSSISLYGDVAGPVLDENTPIVNPDVYGGTKSQCEALLAESGIRGLSLRLPGVLGLGAHRIWLSSVAAKLETGQAIEAFHLDAPFNNAAHINDIANLISKTVARNWTGHDAIVLGARGTITVRGAIERLAAALAKPAHVIAGPPKKPYFSLSSERAIAHWGYDPMEIGSMIDRYAGEFRAWRQHSSG